MKKTLIAALLGFSALAQAHEVWKFSCLVYLLSIQCELLSKHLMTLWIIYVFY